MINATLAKFAQPSQRSLVHGYFLTNFSSFAPLEIIETCILYSFLLETFDDDDTAHSDLITIDSLNAICECTSLSDKIPVQFAVGRNILIRYSKPNTPPIKISEGRFCKVKSPDHDLEPAKIVSFNEETKQWRVSAYNNETMTDETMEFKAEQLEVLPGYHPWDKTYRWRLLIHTLTGSEDGGLVFGFVRNDPKAFGANLAMNTSLLSSSVKTNDYIDFYLDFNRKVICFIRNGWEVLGVMEVLDSSVGYRFCAQFVDAVGKIELVEYQDSNWYRHHIPNDNAAMGQTISRIEAICCAELAITKPAMPFQYFVAALSLFPHYQRWVDALIFRVICQPNTDYDQSFKTALAYQTPGKGGESVFFLLKLCWAHGAYSIARQMLRLLGVDFVNKRKLYGVFAICLADSPDTGNKDECIRYLEMHLKNRTANDEKSGMATFMDQIAFCYQDVDDGKAIELYLEAIKNDDHRNSVEWIRARLGALYAKQKDLGNAKDILLQNITSKPDDYLSYFNYAEFLHEQNEEESETYYTKALELAIGGAEANDDLFLLPVHVVDCYLALKEPTLAVEYLKLYMQNHEDRVELIGVLKKSYIRSGDYDNAILCLDKMLKNDPDDFGDNFEYAQLLSIYDKNETKSKTYFQKTVEIGLKSLDTDEKEEKLNDEIVVYVCDVLSTCYEFLEDQDNALKYCLLVLEKKPNEVSVIHRVANKYYVKKLYDVASDWFKKAIEIGDEDIDYSVFFDYAMCLDDLKQREECKAFLQKSIDQCVKLRAKRKKEDIEQDVAEYMHMSNCYMQLKQLKQIREWVNKTDHALTQLKENGTIKADNSNMNEEIMFQRHFNSSLCYFLAEKDYELALRDLMKIDKEMFKKYGLCCIAASMHRGLRDLENAFACCQTGLDTDCEKDVMLQIHMTMALLLGERGEYNEADKHFNSALSLDKEHKEFELLESYTNALHHYKREYDTSLHFATILSEMACDDGEKCRAMLHLAIVSHYLNKTKQSIKYFDCAVKHAANIDNDIDHEAILQPAGYYCLITKQYESAYKYLWDAYTYDAKDPGNTGLIGICLYLMNRENDSIPYLKRSLEDVIEKNDPFIAPNCVKYYSKILFEQKEYQKCIELLDKWMQTNYFEKCFAHKDEIYYSQSRCYSKLTKFDKALECLTKANQINPERQLYKNQMETIQNIPSPLVDI
eukprot:483968_1